ncbi:MAG TPA: DUF202 domain-containing protein [Nocardioides sp.]|nr:DUF202 domain-containing protein [Nocardioides sp.]
MTTAREPDFGASNERTALGWQRTALSLVAGSAVMTRVAWPALGMVALLPLGAAAALSVWVFLESRVRYGHDAGTRARGGPRGGMAPLGLAVATTLLAATEIAALTLR